MLRLASESPGTPVKIRFDDHQVLDAYEGETVTTALLRAGVLITGRSAKYRRPRGAFCMGGDCGSCLMRIDGQPNVRACMVRVRDGMTVAAQNVVGSRTLDPTALVDKFFRKGMDHHHLMVRPKIANKVMAEVARGLTGLGTLPDRVAPPSTCHTHTPQVLIIGAGRAGRRAFRTLRDAGIDVIVVDRRTMLAENPTVPEGVLLGVRVFAVYPEEPTSSDGAQPAGLIAAAGDDESLHVFRPDHLLLAVGTRDTMIRFPNNDLPGVVTARGLWRQLQQAGSELDVPAIVVGDGVWAKMWSERLGVPAIASNEVRRVYGSGRVEGVETSTGKHACQIVALAAPPAPAHDLVRQCGGRTHWDESGFAAVADGDGRLQGAAGPWRTWVCGTACGLITAEQSDASGAAVARTITAAVQATSAEPASAANTSEGLSDG